MDHIVIYTGGVGHRLYKSEIIELIKIEFGIYDELYIDSCELVIFYMNSYPTTHRIMFSFVHGINQDTVSGLSCLIIINILEKVRDLRLGIIIG